ncbi:aminoglycoside phosphotransferase family protein [Tissierella carlieri]|uniref:Aminoglycoside phosphotransferase family protein n=1 Tax=Tissierella carlieri TaxID=689904 RepID=A0ABT1SAV0_9FIRM|nr:aminoglycoside phosphotransferase family protein [Tissierella carlieri]MBU5314660.1 aminoglycoside phosphotransferase family protein [Tissierella carlieri]MCQ4923596.1 aminoglycoside phosphotransferase family protein [Tissierella carlieri]
MNENIENILYDYSIGKILMMEPMNKGNTSDASYILSDKGKWILRKLKNIDQGIAEHAISNILANDICPKIITTKSNIGYSHYLGNYYNLQEYIPSQPIKNDLETFKELGRVLGILHSKLKNNTDLIEQEDRFSLEDIWKQTKNKWKDVQKQFDCSTFTTSNFEELIDEMVTYQNIKNTFIHGDLGKWNLIYNSKQVYIIDFGEVRRGDHHFDIAATLTSMINFDLGKEFAYKFLYTFYEEYKNYMGDFQWEKLQKNIQLWILRGMLALLLYSSNKPNFIESVKKMIDLELKLSNIICENFI